MTAGCVGDIRGCTDPPICPPSTLRKGLGGITLTSVLREDKTITVVTRPGKPAGWFGLRPAEPDVIQITFGRRGKTFHYFDLDAATAERVARAQTSVPVLIGEHQPKGWLWWYLNRFFWAADPLSDGDVQALVLQREGRKQAQLEKARAALAGDTQPAQPHVGKREPISEAVRSEVWRRDGGACVDCGSRERLEFDHIIPVTKGGANTVRNLELRCESCNRSKGAKI